MEQSPRVDALDHLVLTVTNISDTCRFYQDVLGMQAESIYCCRWYAAVGAEIRTTKDQSA